MSKLTPIAQKLQNLLADKINGADINDITNEIRKKNEYIEKEQVEKTLARYQNLFTEVDGVWRLTALVEKEKRKEEVKRITSSREETNQKLGEVKALEEQHNFSNMREDYIESLRQDLIGPSEQEELIKERPNTLYLGGMLYPANIEVEDIEVQEFGTDEDENKKDYDDDNDEEIASNQNRFQPSSIGLTCNVKPDAERIKINISYGKYEKVKNEKKKFYKRTPVDREVTINLRGKRESFYLEDGKVECLSIVRQKSDELSLSVFLINRFEHEDNVPVNHILFQPEITLTGPHENECIFVRRDIDHDNLIDDKDLDRSRLLYRNNPDFAVGHGCSVQWYDFTNHTAMKIKTSFIPEYEVPAVEHLDIKDMIGLNMYVLSYIGSPSDLKKELSPLLGEYKKWIDNQRKITVDDHLVSQRDKHIEYLEEAYGRIKEGIDIVCSDDQYFEAFKFANEIMLYQRSFSEASKYYRTNGKHLEEMSFKGRWRPFQLAFILLNIKSIVDPLCEERDYVDLLWFPTGGGKTEAYLGLAAFVMALRRLKGAPDGVEGYAGTTVIMRYTLRLLTIQQFQRASALICAAEYLRTKKPEKWGQKSFSIGLWVGGGTTPNQLDGDGSASEALYKLRNNERVYGGNPIQLHNCPKCGQELTPESYNVNRKVFTIQCENNDCFFHRHNIPAYTVDEAIYNQCPTLLIGTVDKFARLPWNGTIASIFGKVDRYCERHGFIREGDDHPGTHNATGDLPKSRTVEIENLRPPELIIQDELHLISGPLGSMVGLYESAIDFLSMDEVNGEKIKPKVVASTATIRRADSQVKGVFNRDVQQFPPSGINSDDSFFSYEVTSDKKPGRKYIGLYFPGSSGKTALVRIYAKLMQKGHDLKEQGEDVNPYWTLAGYFNSLRELGGALRLLEDDIPDRIKYLVSDKRKQRFIKYKEELTSRIDATDIPAILNKLEQNADNKKAVDVLLATNMISVGVDIDRLGMMVITGQPKSTSEYIQASSRVGRKYPGVVFTLYNWSRPRDISHYEQFISYHSKFYSHVEATSVTPYSYRSRDKGLMAVIIGLLRQLDSRLYRNTDAKKFTKENGYIDEIREFIVERCKEIDEIDNEYIEEEIDEILGWWEKRINDNPDNLLYQKFKFTPRDTPVLFRSINQDIKNAELIPDSLRDVEAEVDAYYTFWDEEDEQ
ncbi:DISARM system helicase DrmA [Halobacillus mangrovi]|uniref:DISARM system helicase DrmA n=1 Tax=Halobacillus mangrovi TaxID=402384 RepID=UPI003D997961